MSHFVIPIEEGSITLFALLLITAGFQLFGGAIAYFYVKLSKKYFSQIILIQVISMFLIAFYALPFMFGVSKISLITFFLGAIALYYLHISVNVEGKHSMSNMGALTFGMISLHELVEGLLTGTAFLFDIKVGIVTAFLISIHEIPEGIATGIPFFLSKQYKKGFTMIFLSQIIYLGAGLASFLFTFNKIAIIQIGAFAAGGIAALGIVQLRTLKKLF